MGFSADIDLGPFVSACMACLTCGGIGLVLFLYVRYARAKRVAWERGWQALAARTGLTFETTNSLTDPKPPSSGGPITIRFGVGPPSTTRVTGLYKNRPVTLDTFTEGHPGSDTAPMTTYTRLTIGVNTPAQNSLLLGEKNLLAPEQTVLGGDERFAVRFELASQPEALVRQVFASAQLRERLLALRPRIRVNLEAQALHLMQDQLKTDADDLYAFLELGDDLANAVEQAASA